MATNPTPNPTWYDILGVARGASPADIKAAWRAATDKFEPGSGTSQFRLFNEAADVLLDPQRRAAYDAELDEGTGAGPVEATAAEVAPVEVPAPDDEAEPEPEPVPEPEPEPVPEPGARSAAEADEPARPGAWSAGWAGDVVQRLGANLRWIAVVCVPLVVVSLVVGVVAVTGVDVWKVDVRGIEPAVRTNDAGPEASAAAERALEAVLSYDYRHMDADRDRAARYLTPSYRKDYLKTFELLTVGPNGEPGGAVKTKAVVKADVLDTGVVDAESDRVRVVAFVNQSSTKGDAAPTLFQNRVVATMVQRGDAWLVDNLESY